MTEQIPEADDQATEQADDGQADTDQAGPNREAARYRRQLREAEADRDRIAAVVDTYRRREAEAMLEQAGLTRGADAFDVGTQLHDLLTDDGTVVDPAKVQAAAAAVLADRPHWAKPTRPQGDVGQGPRGADTTGARWADLLKPGR